MKRTTYILMGLLVSGLILIVATVIDRYMSKNSLPKNSIILGPERTEKNLKDVHVVKMIINQFEQAAKKRVVLGGEFTISSSPTPGNDRISYQKSEFLNVSQKEDTLLLAFDISIYNVPADVWKQDYILLLGMDIQLSVDSLTVIESLVNSSTLKLKKLKMDSLVVRGRSQSVLLDSCQFRSFDIAGLESLSFEAKNSKIDNLFIDLDGVWDWQTEHSIIGTEYLTGAGNHNNNIQKGECDRLIWTPKNKDATLGLTLREKAEVSIMKE